MKRKAVKKICIIITAAAVLLTAAAAVVITRKGGSADIAIKPIIKTGAEHIVLHAGGSERIEASVIPQVNGGEKVAFSSEDTDIASVDENGTVTAAGKTGSAVITVSCGGGSAGVRVSVTDKAAEGVTLSESEVTLRAGEWEPMRLTAEVYPDDADVKDVIWTSSDEKVVCVDDEGNIYRNGTGTAVVTAKSADGGYEAECSVTVEPAPQSADRNVTQTDYGITLYDMVMSHMRHLPVFYDSAQNPLPAHDEEVESFANPENFTTGYGIYQFLVLNKPCGVDADTLDAYLNGKGALEGMGGVIKEAAGENGLSEIFLAALACRAGGRSPLSEGIEVNGQLIYNPLGVSDTTADIKALAEFAYKRGWTSVEKAIDGGAKWLSAHYINNSDGEQNTLYKMRWNPKNPSSNLYSDNVEWAQDMADNIGRAYELFPSAEIGFDIPVYKSGRAVAG